MRHTKYLFLGMLLFIIGDLSAQDIYHTELLEFLSESYQIENVTYVLSDNEVDNAEALGVYGNATISVSDIPNFSYSKNINISVNAAGDNAWDSGLTARNLNAIQNEDIVLVTFWAKRNTDFSELFFFAEDGSDFEKEFYFSAGFTPDWSQYFIPFKASKNYPSNTLACGFHLAAGVQNFDIAGYTVLNLGSDLSLEDVPSSFDSALYEGSAEDAPWRALASSRIESIRKADLDIVVVDRNGAPIENAEVTLEMQQHDFGFGSAFVTCRFPGNNCFNPTYIEKLTNLDGKGHGFNVGVTENAMKWDGWEEEWLGSPEDTKSAIQWLTTQNIEMRGHTLFWPGYGNLPEDISDNRNDIPYIRNRIEGRINSMLTDPVLSQTVTEWDVLNEITVNRDLEAIFNNDPSLDQGREIYSEIFKLCKETMPELSIYVNDYVVLSGGGSASSVVNRYKSFLNEMQEYEVPFDGIGFQCHIGSNPTSILKVQSVLDEFYQRYEARMKITEYDINPLVDEELQAKYLSDFLTMVFSHPGVDAFIMWGFWDGNHWKVNSPMFDLNWNLKPSGQAFIDKVFDEWWSTENDSTNSDGRVSWRPFKGLHKITVNYNNETKESVVKLTEDNTIQIVLEGVTATAEILDSEIKVVPNIISNDDFHLMLPSSIPYVSIDIIDAQGSILKTYDKVSSSTLLNINGPAGTYLLKCEIDGSIVYKKVVKK